MPRRRNHRPLQSPFRKTRPPCSPLRRLFRCTEHLVRILWGVAARRPWMPPNVSCNVLARGPAQDAEPSAYRPAWAQGDRCMSRRARAGARGIIRAPFPCISVCARFSREPRAASCSVRGERVRAHAASRFAPALFCQRSVQQRAPCGHLQRSGRARARARCLPTRTSTFCQRWRSSPSRAPGGL